MPNTAGPWEKQKGPRKGLVGQLKNPLCSSAPRPSNGGSYEQAEDHPEGDVPERGTENNPQDHAATRCQSCPLLGFSHTFNLRVFLGRGSPEG